MRTSGGGGGGGGGVVSDFGHPRTRGGGGVKKGQIFADVLYGWPLSTFKLVITPLLIIEITQFKNWLVGARNML